MEQLLKTCYQQTNIYLYIMCDLAEIAKVSATLYNNKTQF